MKVMKNIKKLKFWSRKKKKKVNFVENPAANAPCCYHNHQFQPSAPPLPPYYEQIHEASYSASLNYHTFSRYPSNDFQFAFPSEENDIDPEIKPSHPALPISSTSSSYQQYMVPNPVYGMPVVPTARRERSVGVFGCVFNVGKLLVRFACPCFRITEAY
ncbi:hypothetical protein DCAR_0103482 [Daucus carota subsp. sativus]|uniref:Uncharacterized protein n=1 Tax=Daucus carota subsp. sativus TaxID=79200 RepID=A0A166I0J4_DAUCS|nr:PREDICTED: uncharacterized protein LOC108197599 [Daucus carota subsp. sativus]WOG84299.1 hypothetical protein DCAR_0103482 [Daucus carota subsp. sativus]